MANLIVPRPWPVLPKYVFSVQGSQNPVVPAKSNLQQILDILEEKAPTQYDRLQSFLNRLTLDNLNLFLKDKHFLEVAASKDQAYGIILKWLTPVTMDKIKQLVGMLDDLEIMIDNKFTTSQQLRDYFNRNFRGRKVYITILKLNNRLHMLRAEDVQTALKLTREQKYAITQIRVIIPFGVDEIKMTLQQLINKLPNLSRVMMEDTFINELHFRHNPNLRALHCVSNNLYHLDVTKNQRLRFIDCYKNKLQELDLSNNTMLERVNCSDNRLQVLKLPKMNKIEKLDHTGNMAGFRIEYS